MANNELNGLSIKRNNTAERIIKALKETQGLLTMAARKAGVSYATVKRYAAELPSVREAVAESKESMTDFTEGKLFRKIRDGDVTSIIFYLKTKGKARGYTERQEITGADGQPMRHIIEVTDERTKKELGAFLNG